MESAPTSARKGPVACPPTPAGAQPLIKFLGGRWLDFSVLALACYAIGATLFVAFDELAGWIWPVNIAVSMTVCLTLCSLAYASGVRTRLLLCRASSQVEATPLWLVVSAGLALRLMWNLLFHAHPGSDAATYVHLAQKLAAGEPYEAAGTRAYWPIGYPAYLSVWFSLLGDGRAVLLASNLVLYLIAALGINRAATRLAGTGAGKIATLLFALWPNLIAMSATPEKEMLLTALLPWAFCLLLHILQTGRVTWRSLASGLVLGGCMLVQPSFLFLPVLGALLIFGYGSVTRRSFLAAAFLVAGSVLAVGPWTLRNYALFHRFVLVSTNGGDNLYRANNPLATGGYTARGEIDLRNLDELERDAEGRKLAIVWMRSHPAAFAILAVEKQVRFLGDDSTGVYNTFKVGGAPHSRALYFGLKAGANGWWVAAWLAVIVLLTGSTGNRAAPLSTARLPVWLWLYLFSVHSVFESSGKYHVDALWAFCVLFGVYVSALRVGASGSEAGRAI